MPPVTRGRRTHLSPCSHACAFTPPIASAQGSFQHGRPPMIQFVCESCLRVKGPKEAWILGYAAESLGVTANQRELTILPDWDTARALHPLAVHFCSERCKKDYQVKVFGEGLGRKSTQRRAVDTTQRPRSEARSGRSRARKTQRRKRAA